MNSNGEISLTNKICLRSFNASTQLSIFPFNFWMTHCKRANTDGSSSVCSVSLNCFANATACSRIHCRAFSRFPAAIKLELDECSLVNELDPGVPLLLALLWLSFENECECDDVVRPQRAGFNEAKNDVVREFDPKRERDDDEPELLLPPLPPAIVALGGVDKAVDDGVLRPEEPNVTKRKL